MRWVKIGSVFDIINGATPASENSDFWDGEIPWITPADLAHIIHD
jgi:type I restriction enzyme S subunit